MNIKRVYKFLSKLLGNAEEGVSSSQGRPDYPMVGDQNQHLKGSSYILLINKLNYCRSLQCKMIYVFWHEINE